MTFPRTACVLVMSTDVLLKRAFARLLTMGSNVEIVISEAVDIQELIDDICATNPDAVLFSESISFSQADSLSHIMKVHPMPKVIIVSEDSNWLHIICREDRLITDLSDLLYAINPA